MGESPGDTDVSRRDVDQRDAAYHDSICDTEEIEAHLAKLKLADAKPAKKV